MARYRKRGEPESRDAVGPRWPETLVCHMQGIVGKFRNAGPAGFWNGTFFLMEHQMATSETALGKVLHLKLF